MINLIWRTTNHTYDVMIEITERDGQYWYKAKSGDFQVEHPIVHTTREEAIAFGVEHYEGVIHCKRMWELKQCKS